MEKNGKAAGTAQSREKGHLVLTLNTQERIVIGDIEISFFWSGSKPRVAINAPKTTNIERKPNAQVS